MLEPPPTSLVQTVPPTHDTLPPDALSPELPAAHPLLVEVLGPIGAEEFPARRGPQGDDESGGDESPSLMHDSSNVSSNDSSNDNREHNRRRRRRRVLRAAAQMGLGPAGGEVTPMPAPGTPQAAVAQHVQTMA